MNTTSAVATHAESSTTEQPSVNGWFTLAINGGGFNASIRKIVRHSGQGKPVTAEAILNKLKKEKVIHGINMDTIQELIKSVDENNIPTEEVIIATSDVEHGENGSLEWHLEGIEDENTQVLVIPGMQIALKKPASRGRPGKNIFGKRVNPRPGFAPPLEAGPGITTSKGKDGEIIYEAKYLGELKYTDNTLSVDAKIRVSDDKLAAHMDIYGAIGDIGMKIPEEEIFNTIEAHGIKKGILVDNIKAALTKAHEENIAVENILIAEGKPAVNGQDAVLDWQFDINAQMYAKRYALPNQLIVTRTPPMLSSVGYTIYDEVLPATDGKIKNINSGEGVSVTEVDGKEEYRAKWLGVIDYQSDTLSLTPDLKISEDEMEVTMGLYLNSGGKEKLEVSLNHIKTMLIEYGITFGINDREINAALEQARANDKSHIELIVAKGKPPRHGVNADLKIDQKISNGKLLPNGKIDYHEKSYPWNIKANDVIGHVTKPVPAEDGKTVTGQTLAATPVQELKLVLKEVAQGRDRKLRATRDGVLLINGTDIQVSDSLVVNGNVSQDTGNINSDSSVIVKGYVEDGYMVRAKKGDVIVHENVENGKVYSRGGINIKAGVRGLDSIIAAAKNITANFAENAKLISSGDFTITNSLINCDVYCKGHVYIRNKGTIVGGITRAKKGMEAANLGSEGFLKTIIIAGSDVKLVEQYKTLKEDVRNKKSELDDLDRLYNHYKQEPGKNVEELLKKLKITHKSKLAEYRQVLLIYKKIKAKYIEAKKIRVVVHQNVYPGVRIQMLDQTYEVKTQRKNGVFCLIGEHIIFQQS